MSSAKVILHVIDTTGPGGAETIFIELADKLRQRGYHSVALIRGPGWVRDQLLARGLTPYVFDAKGSFNWRFLREMFRIIRREKVDVIQSHLLGSNVYCAIVGMLARKPVIATFHGMVDVGPQERFRAAKLWLMNRGVTRFVSVSKNLRAAIDREGLLNPAKCEIIYNGIDISRYGRIAGGELRERLRLPESAVLIGSLGNVRPAKGYDILIKAVPQIVASYPNVHFVIAGDIKTSLTQQLKLLCSEHGVIDRVHFLGFSSNAAAFLAQLDLFLLSSRSEGFSISTIEAMATGLPVLATRCGGPEEIITDTVDGILVAVEDPTAIADGVLKLLGDADLRVRVAENAKHHARAAFDINNMLRRYVELYEP